MLDLHVKGVSCTMHIRLLEVNFRTKCQPSAQAEPGASGCVTAAAHMHESTSCDERYRERGMIAFHKGGEVRMRLTALTPLRCVGFVPKGISTMPVLGLCGIRPYELSGTACSKDTGKIIDLPPVFFHPIWSHASWHRAAASSTQCGSDPTACDVVLHHVWPLDPSASAHITRHRSAKIEKVVHVETFGMSEGGWCLGCLWTPRVDRSSSRSSAPLRLSKQKERRARLFSPMPEAAQAGFLAVHLNTVGQ